MSTSESVLESPHEWGMHDIMKNHFQKRQPRTSGDIENYYDEDEIPLLRMMWAVTETFGAILMEDLENIKLNMLKLDVAKEIVYKENLDDQGLSKKVIRNVVNAVKTHALRKLALDFEADFTKCDIVSLENRDGSDQSTLDGLKSIAFGNFPMGTSKAIQFSEKAVEVNKKCGIFYFVLAKNLRRYRRYDKFGFREKPSLKEKDACSRAYALSKDPVFGIHLAQCYKECKEFARSEQVYRKMYDTSPKRCKIHLRLALGFINFEVFDLAEKCLDYVATQCPDDKTFLHYKGLFLMKSHKNLDEAAILFKKAVDKGNFPANASYIECCEMIAAEKSVEHLKSLIKTYEKNPKESQQIHLNIALYSHVRLNNNKQALIYFKKAIEIDPRSMALEKFSMRRAKPILDQNFCDYLKHDFLPMLLRSLDSSRDTEMKQIHDELTSYCNSNLSLRKT